MSENEYKEVMSGMLLDAAEEAANGTPMLVFAPSKSSEGCVSWPVLVAPVPIAEKDDLSDDVAVMRAISWFSENCPGGGIIMPSEHAEESD